jgi:hypothetical protein
MFAPLPDEPWVQSGPDKFLNTGLGKILKEKGSARTPHIAAICKGSWTTHCNSEHGFTAIDSGGAHYDAWRLYFCRRYDRCDCVARG